MHHRRINSPPLGAIRGVPIYTPLLCGGVVYLYLLKRNTLALSKHILENKWYIIAFPLTDIGSFILLPTQIIVYNVFSARFSKKSVIDLGRRIENRSSY